MRLNFTITGTYDLDDTSINHDGNLQDEAETMVDECLSEALSDYDNGIRILEIKVRAEEKLKELK